MTKERRGEEGDKWAGGNLWEKGETSEGVEDDQRERTPRYYKGDRWQYKRRIQTKQN